MNKKLIAFFSILSLFLSTPLIPANAAAKAGAKCNKAGITEVVKDKSYTCVKTGKKLVWNKGVKVVTTSATPKTREDKAFEAMRSIYVAQPVYKAPINYVLAEKVNKSYFELIRAGTEEAAKTFQKYYKPIDEIPLIMGDHEDIEWVASAMRRYGHEMDNWARNNFNRGWGTGLNNGQSTIVVYTGDQKTVDCFFCILSFGVHEYFHAITIGILGKGSTFGEVIPRWAYEGSASFFGDSIAEQMPQKGEVPDWMRKQGPKNFTRENNVKNRAPILHSLSSQQLYETFISPDIDLGNCPQTYCYTAGQFLIELLVADHGVDKYISWLKVSVNTPWRTTFEETFGTNFNQWLAEIGIPYVMQEAQKAYPKQSVHPDYKKAIVFTRS